MQFVWDGIKGGVDLITSGDDYVWDLIWVTLKVAAISTAVALLLGLPLGLWIGIGARRRRSARRERGGGAWALAVGNAGLGLPPVVVGIVLSLFFFPAGPLGDLHLIFTLDGVIVAQTALAFPIVVALSASAVRSLPPGLLAQARALGANTAEVWLLALREARVGCFAAGIAALGSALSEVGAVVLVGGNAPGSTQTLASAALEQVNAGHYGQGMAIGIVLLGLLLLLTGALTVVQLGGARLPRRQRAAS